MTVRVKILALSAALLVLFAIVLVSSVVMQKQSSSKLSAVIDFHLPLAAVIADLDVATDQYELIVQRLLLRAETSASAIEATRTALEKDRTRISADFEKADRLLEGALVDPRTDGQDRVALARVQRSLAYLKRVQTPYFALGDEIILAMAHGRPEQARSLSLQLKNFEQAWGPDMAEVRQELAGLARTSTGHIYERQSSILRLNLALFAIAVVAGIGLSAVSAKRLVRALRRLIEGAKAIEAGDLATTVPVTSRDEIGQLTQAFNRMAEELRTKERIKDTFGKYVDPRIVARLIDTSKEDLEQAERHVATVMFSDLKGFTTMSEQLTAASMVKLLNSYFTVVAEQIRAHRGILEKYIGDAVMAFWTPPFTSSDEHASCACLAALAHRDALVTLRLELPHILGLRRNLPELTVRMGLATGEVVVGTIGAPTAKSFAAIGDVTNLASRLEGVNKIYGTTVILSEETHRLAQHTVEARELDVVVVVGKSESVRIFELIGRAGEADGTMQELRGLYADGLEAYRRRDWNVAERRFTECLKIRPADGPAEVLRARVVGFKATPPTADWDGVWRLTEK
jgi:adenylate cyclase